MRKSTLEDRLQEAVGKPSAVSMVPAPRPTKAPPKEDEKPPDIRELLDDPQEQNLLLRLVDTSAALGQQISEANKARKPITEQIKRILGDYGIGKAMVGECRVAFFNVPRSSISKELLLNHGVNPDVIAACTVTKDNPTLKITSPGGADDD